MPSTPAPLPSLGLLDGLGGVVLAQGGNPAPFPALGLLGGFSPAAAPAPDPARRMADEVPAAWFADVGFGAAYSCQQQLGISIANRADVGAGPAAQGGDPAPLPHLGLLLAATATINLVAAASTQANLSSSGAISIDGATINLTAADSTQANLSSTGAVSVAGGTIDLAAADSTQENTSSSGAIFLSDIPPDALPGYTAVARPRRASKPTAFDVKDPDETIWTAFDFRLITTGVSNISITALRFSGADDDNPSAILSGSPLIVGPKVLQRVVAGVDACTYHLECLVDAADGSRFSLAALLPVRSV